MPVQAAKMANGGSDVRKATFTRSLEALNSQFARWATSPAVGGSGVRQLLVACVQRVPLAHQCTGFFHPDAAGWRSRAAVLPRSFGLMAWKTT